MLESFEREYKVQAGVGAGGTANNERATGNEAPGGRCSVKKYEPKTE